jgi:hypothetical protein
MITKSWPSVYPDEGAHSSGRQPNRMHLVAQAGYKTVIGPQPQRPLIPLEEAVGHTLMKWSVGLYRARRGSRPGTAVVS